MVKLSIVVPVYNEEEAIGKVIEDIKKTMRKARWKHEIIVVDDGSTDKTAKIAKKKNLKLIQHPYNKGYGAAIKTGIRKARGEFVLIIDGDGTYPPQEILKLLKHANKYDMVVGARIGKKVNIPISRRPAKFILANLANYLSGVRIPDLNSGLRIFKKEVALQFFKVLPSKFSFTSTITLSFLSSDYLVKYVPIDYHKRKGKSKIKASNFFDFSLLIIRTIAYFNPLKIFLPACFLLIFLAIFVFFYSFFVFGRVMDITTIVLFLTAIQIGFFGLLADLIRKK